MRLAGFVVQGIADSDVQRAESLLPVLHTTLARSKP